MGNSTCKPQSGGEGLKAYLRRKFMVTSSGKKAKRKIDDLVKLAVHEDVVMFMQEQEYLSEVDREEDEETPQTDKRSDIAEVERLGNDTPASDSPTPSDWNRTNTSAGGQSKSNRKRNKAHTSQLTTVRRQSLAVSKVRSRTDNCDLVNTTEVCNVSDNETTLSTNGDNDLDPIQHSGTVTPITSTPRVIQVKPCIDPDGRCLVSPIQSAPGEMQSTRKAANAKANVNQCWEISPPPRKGFRKAYSLDQSATNGDADLNTTTQDGCNSRNDARQPPKCLQYFEISPPPRRTRSRQEMHLDKVNATSRVTGNHFGMNGKEVCRSNGNVPMNERRSLDVSSPLPQQSSPMITQPLACQPVSSRPDSRLYLSLHAQLQSGANTERSGKTSTRISTTRNQTTAGALPLQTKAKTLGVDKGVAFPRTIEELTNRQTRIYLVSQFLNTQMFKQRVAKKNRGLSSWKKGLTPFQIWVIEHDGTEELEVALQPARRRHNNTQAKVNCWRENTPPPFFV